MMTMETNNNAGAGRSAGTCSAVPVIFPDRYQMDILWHTEHRAAGGLYCGGGPDVDALVEAGLMEYAGRKSFVPDPYYRITAAGREVLRGAKWKQNANCPPVGEKGKP